MLEFQISGLLVSHNTEFGGTLHPLSIVALSGENHAFFTWLATAMNMVYHISYQIEIRRSVVFFL